MTNAFLDVYFIYKFYDEPTLIAHKFYVREGDSNVQPVLIKGVSKVGDI